MCLGGYNVLMQINRKVQTITNYQEIQRKGAKPPRSDSGEFELR